MSSSNIFNLPIDPFQPYHRNLCPGELPDESFQLVLPKYQPVSYTASRHGISLIL